MKYIVITLMTIATFAVSGIAQKVMPAPNGDIVVDVEGGTSKTIKLADKRDGKPLDAKQGPWQIVATGELKHARWVRQVTALKVRLAK